MTPTQVFNHFGKDYKSAAAGTSYTVQSIRDWIKANRIPPRAQVVIESITGGALKASKPSRK